MVSNIFLIIFIPTWGNDPIWRAYFSDGWEKTTNEICIAPFGPGDQGTHHHRTRSAWTIFFGQVRRKHTRNIPNGTPRAPLFSTVFGSGCSSHHPLNRGLKWCLTRWWFQIIFIFYPYLGKWSNFTNIFQRSWNHQLVMLNLHNSFEWYSKGFTRGHVSQNVWNPDHK